jgi:enoyl-CoA hydratase/carnithine racemase
VDLLTPGDLSRWLEGPDGQHPPGDQPVAVVDLEAPAPPNPNEIADRVAAVPCVVVGLGPSASAPPYVDVAVTGAELDAVLATIARAPIASTAFALLLRGSSGRGTVAEGLIAESATYSMLQAGPEFAAWREARPSRTRPDHDPVVRTERLGAELRVVLNRPRVLNALNARMRDELVAALTVAVVDPSIATVVLEGAGPAFCAGGDLDEFGQRDDPASAHLVRLTRSPALLLSRLAPRVVARLHGACFGSGIELPAFAGRVVAAPDTRIALPELGLGLVPGAGGTVSLPARIGRHRTAWLGLSGATIDAATALAWGLVDEIATVA